MANNAILIQGLIELHLKGEGAEQAVASMTKIVAQAKQVNEATGGLGAGAEKAAKGVGVLESSFVSLGKTVATYFAAGMVANFLKDSFLGFARTERQALAVENQLRALGQATQGAGFRDFIQQLSTTSGILDDDLVPAFQRALGAFKDYAAAQEVATLASKFAAAGIGEVGSNVDAIARFFQTGMARGLTQFGIDIKGGEEATLSLTEGLRLLREQAGLLPATFDDAQAAINRWRVELDTAKDSIGKGLALVVSSIEDAGTAWGEVLDQSLGFGETAKQLIEKTKQGQQILDELSIQGAKKTADAKTALDRQAGTARRRSRTRRTPTKSRLRSRPSRNA